MKEKLARAEVSELESRRSAISRASKVLAAQVDGMDREQLRTLVDSLRNKWKTAVVVLASSRGFERLHRRPASPRT